MDNAIILIRNSLFSYTELCTKQYKCIKTIKEFLRIQNATATKTTAQLQRVPCMTYIYTIIHIHTYIYQLQPNCSSRSTARYKQQHVWRPPTQHSRTTKHSNNKITRMCCKTNGSKTSWSSRSRSKRKVNVDDANGSNRNGNSSGNNNTNSCVISTRRRDNCALLLLLVILTLTHIPSAR